MLDIIMIQILFSPIRIMVYLLVSVGVHVALGADLSWEDYFGKKGRGNENRVTIGKVAAYAGILYVFCVLCFENKILNLF